VTSWHSSEPGRLNRRTLPPRMRPMELALLLKPLATALFFCLVYVIARGVMALIPQGRLRTLLMSPIRKRQRAGSASWSSKQAQ